MFVISVFKVAVQNWNDTSARKTWEEQFYANYIQNHTQQIDQLLQNASTAIMNDHRLGKFLKGKVLQKIRTIYCIVVTK